jgi:23S rRNA-/tRNA-specific pseudouridylate synthase
MKQSLYIVHRLDKDTSGLMIFAKNRLAASNISKLFQDNQIHKYYIAITNKSFKKTSDILSNENNEKKILKSQYRRIRIANYEFAYLVKLITGRKHQIRLQFYLNNNPILGDKKFSEQNDGNLMLKSTSLSFFYQDKFYKFKLDLNQIFE